MEQIEKIIHQADVGMVNPHPHHRDGDHRSDRRQKECGAVKRKRAHRTVQQDGDEQRDRHARWNRADRKVNGVPDGLPEIFRREQQLVIRQTVEGRLAAQNAPFEEREPQRVGDREIRKDREDDETGREERVARKPLEPLTTLNSRN